MFTTVQGDFTRSMPVFGMMAIVAYVLYLLLALFFSGGKLKIENPSN